MQTAAAYIRVSTEEQTEYSPDSQLKMIREYARAHEINLPESLIFQDEGISGRFAKKRPAFLKMIGMAKQKPRPFDLILVWKFSRFARSRQDSILYKSMLRKDCGIQVLSITEHLTDDPTAILIEALLEAMDEYYSINLAQEVRRGMNEKFSRGGVVSIPPFGYRMGSEHFEIDADQAPFVRRMFLDFLDGFSFRQIASRLNEWGVCTARGNPFESRTVTYILTNPVYLGKLRRSIEEASLPGSSEQKSMCVVEGAHPPLITPEIFDQVQKQIAAKKRQPHTHARTAASSYMLRGLVRCSCCGSTLTVSEQGRSLQCPKYTKGRCQVSHHIRLEKLNKAVLIGLKEDLYGALPDFCIQRTVRLPEDNTLFRLLEREERRLERVLAAYEAGIDSLDEYRRKKTEITSRIQRLREDAARARKTAPETLPDHLKLSSCTLFSLLSSDQMTESAKNALLHSLLSHITFCRPEDTIQLHYRI